jgi:hypothetical protein
MELCVVTFRKGKIQAVLAGTRKFLKNYSGMSTKGRENKM